MVLASPRYLAQAADGRCLILRPASSEEQSESSGADRFVVSPHLCAARDRLRPRTRDAARLKGGILRAIGLREPFRLIPAYYIVTSPQGRANTARLVIPSLIWGQRGEFDMWCWSGRTFVDRADNLAVFLHPSLPSWWYGADQPSAMHRVAARKRVLGV
jgi:hypothetical protein